LSKSLIAFTGGARGANITAKGVAI